MIAAGAVGGSGWSPGGTMESARLPGVGGWPSGVVAWWRW